MLLLLHFFTWLQNLTLRFAKILSYLPQNPLAGGEGAGCLVLKIPTPLSALGLEPHGLRPLVSRPKVEILKRPWYLDPRCEKVICKSFTCFITEASHKNNGMYE